MGVNFDKPGSWKADVAQSVDLYNAWFLNFAPQAFRNSRIQATAEVARSLLNTRYLRQIAPQTFRNDPKILPTLRMSTCPPLAVDRLIGLAGIKPNLVKSLETKQRLPPRMPAKVVDGELARIGAIISRMADPDIFIWLARNNDPTQQEAHRAATIIADRLCGSFANPIIRNAQESRQLDSIRAWLNQHGYSEVSASHRHDFRLLAPGTFGFRFNVKVLAGNSRPVNIPIDAVVMPKGAKPGQLPVLIEAKSAGDFTNTNKRRKEEAIKVAQLKTAYGDGVVYVLFLCGYFDTGYLGYEAAEGIDWVWEHRIGDMTKLGL